MSTRWKKIRQCSISLLVHAGRSPGMILLCLSASRIYNTFSISTRSRRNNEAVVLYPFWFIQVQILAYYYAYGRDWIRYWRKEDIFVITSKALFFDKKTFYFFLHFSSRSGKLLGKFQDLSKNSRLCTSTRSIYYRKFEKIFKSNKEIQTPLRDIYAILPCMRDSPTKPFVSMFSGRNNTLSKKKYCSLFWVPVIC